MENLFFKLLDVDACKKAIAETAEDEICILMGHYSINIQMEYAKADDPDQIDWDWQDFEDAIDWQMYVNDFDDLCVDPHGLELA